MCLPDPRVVKKVKMIYQCGLHIDKQMTKGSKKKTKCKYLFQLNGIDVFKIHTKYGIPIEDDINPSCPPENTTQITMLTSDDESNRGKINYLDETKKLRSCTVSQINFDQPDLCCWWCKV